MRKKDQIPYTIPLTNKSFIMQETYNGNSRKIKLSPQEIRKMKENMQKVPEIQKKSD